MSLASAVGMTFWPTVFAGLVVFGVPALSTWMWRRRRVPVVVGAQHIESRRARHAQENRDALEREWRDELRRRGADVIVAVAGRNPSIVTYESGRRQTVYTAFQSYKAAGLRGDHHGYDAIWQRRVPIPVTRLSIEQLRKLLRG